MDYSELDKVDWIGEVGMLDCRSWKQLDWSSWISLDLVVLEQLDCILECWIIEVGLDCNREVGLNWMRLHWRNWIISEKFYYIV